MSGPLYTAKLEHETAQQKATIRRLAAALKQCADELADEIEARYPAERRAQYPSYQLKYERDMQTVVDARAALREAGDAGVRLADVDA